MALYDDSHLGQVEGYNGPTTGFFENMRAAFDQQFRVDSFLSLEAEAQNQWAESLKAYERLTGQAVNLDLSSASMNNYIRATLGEAPSVWQATTAIPGVTEWDFSQANARRAEFTKVNDAIKALNNPDIKSLDQVVQEIIEMRARVTGESANVADRASMAGWLGSVVGGIGGSFSTRDPLLLATMGFGGFGKSLATKLASEMAVGGAVEATQQFIGVQPTRELLNEQPTSPWNSILYSALGAGILRGGVEVGAVGLRRLREGVGGVTFDDFDLSDTQLESMFNRVDTPTSRAGQHALEAQQHFNVLNPYTSSDAGMRRFIAELSEVQQITAGMTDTAMRQLPVEQLPLDLDNLSFEMRQVKETEPVVFARFEVAQTRLDEINQQIAEVEGRMASINEADGLERIDPDTAELARSYIRDLDSPTATQAQREIARRQLDSIAETIGVERIAKETADAAIAPRQELRSLRQSRKAAMREFKAARDAVDAQIARQEQSARLREAMEQRKAMPDLSLYAKVNEAPYVGPLMEQSAVTSSFAAAAEQQAILPTISRGVSEMPEGMIDIGEGKLIPADFTIEIDGKPMTAKAILADFDEDDKLVAAMGQCAL